MLNRPRPCRSVGTPPGMHFLAKHVEAGYKQSYPRRKTRLCARRVACGGWLSWAKPATRHRSRQKVFEDLVRGSISNCRNSVHQVICSAVQAIAVHHSRRRNTVMASDAPESAPKTNRAFYDRISGVYDALSDSNEHAARETGQTARARSITEFPVPKPISNTRSPS